MLILARWHLYTETVPCQCYDLKMLAIHLNVTGISLGMRPANEKRRYSVTTSLISWAHTYTDPCCKLVCYVSSLPVTVTLTSRGRHGVANRRQFECLFNSLFRLYLKKTSKLSLSCPLWGESIGDRCIPLKKDPSCKTALIIILSHIPAINITISLRIHPGIAQEPAVLSSDIFVRWCKLTSQTRCFQFLLVLFYFLY